MMVSILFRGKEGLDTDVVVPDWLAMSSQVSPCITVWVC